MAEYKLLINGELVNSSTGKVVDDIGPASGEAVAQIPQSGLEDVERAVTAAREAFDDGRWSRLPHGARAAALEKLAQVLEAHTEELAELESLDAGKPIKLARDSDIPHRTKMSDYIDELGNEIQNNLKEEFKSLPPDRRISLTFDGWTSSTMIPFIGVTAHYVDENWRMNTALLFFGELPGSHSGENLAKCLYDIIVEYDIVARLMSITSDNVSTNDKAMECLGKLIRGKSFAYFDAKEQRAQ